jgi:hypothetical protein
VRRRRHVPSYLKLSLLGGSENHRLIRLHDGSYVMCETGVRAVLEFVFAVSLMQYVELEAC